MLKSTISIIVPIYNASVFLKKCIDSIVAQTYAEFELLLINDGSTDTSLNIALSYAKIENRIVLINQTNQGVSAARNHGLLKASGDYIAFVDADDWLEPEYLNELVNDIVTNEADLVCVGYYDYSVYAKRLAVHDFKEKGSVLKAEEMMHGLLSGTAGVPWAKLYRKSIIDQFKIRFNEKIKMSEDLVFNLEYISNCKKIIINEFYGYNYNRLNCISVSSKINPDYFDSYELSNELILQLWSKKRLDDLHLLGWMNKRYESFIITVCSNIAVDKRLVVFKRIKKIKSFMGIVVNRLNIRQLKDEKSILLNLLLNKFYYCSFFCFLIQNYFSKLKLKIKRIIY
jgi:glycosyltransferase involved in cell wall biosynthesis